MRLRSGTSGWKIAAGARGSTSWAVFAGWVASRMPEFQVRARDEKTLRLSRTLEADVFTVDFRPRPSDRDARVEVAFESRPF